MTAQETTRQELLAALARLSRLRPEWRLGQTLANLAMTAGHLESDGVWELEDAEALAAATTLIDQYSELESDHVQPAPIPNLGITSACDSSLPQPPRQVN